MPSSTSPRAEGSSTAIPSTPTHTRQRSSRSTPAGHNVGLGLQASVDRTASSSTPPSAHPSYSHRRQEDHALNKGPGQDEDWGGIDDFSPKKPKANRIHSSPRSPNISSFPRLDIPPSQGTSGSQLWSAAPSPGEATTSSSMRTIPPSSSSTASSFLTPSSAYFVPDGRYASTTSSYWATSDPRYFAGPSAASSMDRRDSETRLYVAPTPPQQHAASFPSTSSSRAQSEYQGGSTNAESQGLSARQAEKQREIGEYSPRLSEHVGRGDRNASSQPARSVSPTRRTRRMTAGARILELFSYIALKIPIRLRKYQPSSSRDGHRPSPSKPPLPSRKPNLAWRLFKLACIVFSLLYFTLDTAKGINSISRRSNVLRQEDLDIIDSSLPLLKLDKPLNPGWSGSAKKKLHTVYSGAASVLRGSRVNGNNPADAVEDAVPRPIQQTFDGIPDVGRRFSDDGAQETGFIKSSLSALSNSYRFSKLFSTVDSGLHGNIEPFAFNAEEPGPKKGVTACLYYNEAWLSLLPEFMKRWHGLASVVVEVLGNEDSTSARRVHEAIEDLRASDEDITYLVDFHIVYTPLPATSSIADRARDRMLTKPTSSNFHLNLARFFARTDLVWLVGDSRIVPPHDLRRKLDNMPIVRTIALDKADAIVIPTFGLTRDVPSQSTQYHFPDLDEMREGQASGLGSDEIVEEEGEAYRSLAQDYVRSVLASLPIPLSHWPNRKDPLAGLAANRPPGSLIPAHLAAHQGPLFYLSDVGWDKGKGPTNFQEWRKHRRSPPSSSGDGGAGVQQDGQEAQEEQEDAFYLLRDHDPQYSPSLLIGKDRQPWCPERFEHNRAACAYQMFIAGSNMHVMSDGWAYTFADVDDAYGDQDSDEADRLKDTVTTRLYTKFHSEVCIHYGRNFVSTGLWETERADNLRRACAKILSTYGIGRREA